MTRPSLIRDVLSDRRGVVAPVTAVVFAVLLGMVGLVTDAGVWFSAKRDLQAATDAAALGSARYARDGQGVVANRVRQLLVANGETASSLVSAQVGYYCPSATNTAQFQASRCAGAAITTPINAVTVRTQTTGSIIFSRLFTAADIQNRPIYVTSTAALVNEAGLRAGTGLVDFNGGVVNATLSALTGSNISLTAVEYNALLNTNVNALEYLDGLSTQVGVTAGTYDSLLRSNATVDDLIAAAISALGRHPEIADYSATIAGLRALKGTIAGSRSIALGTLFDLGVWKTLPVNHSGSSEAALSAGLNIYQLITASLQIANGSNALALSKTLDLGIIAKASLGTTVIEPPAQPVFGFGPVGTTVHTAQVRSLLQLSLLPIGGYSLSSLDLYIESASGDARIQEITCPDAPSTQGDLDTKVKINARSGVADVYLGKYSSPPAAGTLTNFSTPITPPPPANLVDLGLLGRVSVGAHTALAEGLAPNMLFVQPSGAPDLSVKPDLTTGVIGRPASDLTTASAPRAARVSSSNLGSGLLRNLTLNTQVCLIVCLPPAVTGLVSTIVSTLTSALGLLDPLVNELLRALGVQVGYMDVFVTGVRCGIPVLVE